MHEHHVSEFEYLESADDEDLDACEYQADNPCRADSDYELREQRTNKKLQNQPYYQRNRNGKMRHY